MRQRITLLTLLVPNDESGIEFREAPRNEPYGKDAVFSDPFGNLWDLIQPAA